MVSSAVSAYAWCSALAAAHYENFPVASVLLPKHMRRHVAAVYAFARVADDVADEASDLSLDERKECLDFFHRAVNNPALAANHPIFCALYATFGQTALSPSPLQELLVAFRRDVQGATYTTWPQVFDYCRYSANPVGTILLTLDGAPPSDESNHICTALQIVNFLQDLSRDIPHGRWYVPGITAQTIQENNATEIRHHLKQATETCRTLFAQGLPVVRQPKSFRLRAELRMICAGGLAMLSHCETMQEKLLVQRPTLRFPDYFCMLTAVFNHGKS
jgi:hydroxysqualene synthase